MRPLWIKSAAVLLAVWLIAGGAMWWAKAQKPTPEALAAYVEALAIENKTPAQRTKEMEKIAKQLNGLTYQQRREVRMNRKLDKFFRQLNPEEQNRFLDLTVPEGFKQMMEALNKMEPPKRKQFVSRALKDMQDQEGEAPEGSRDRFERDTNAQKIVEQGLKSFYSEASAETKMDLAPLIEQFQRNLQGLR
ncbi:MAG: hypothetical protein ABMA13_17935 [Chthoniobacteraceae bacterium]